MENQFYRFVKNEAGDSELYLEGVIAQESWWDDEVTPKQFREQLDKHTGDIKVRINSPGGDAFAGIQIYNMLKDRSGKVHVIVDALAASAASVVAMAGDTITMNTGSMMMIHKASTFAWGNEEEIQEIVKSLQAVDESLVTIYTARTGKTEDEVKELLAGSGTWMTADEAIELGFATDATEGKTSLSEAVQNVLGFTKQVHNAAMQPVLSIQNRVRNEEKVEEKTTETPVEAVETEEIKTAETQVDEVKTDEAKTETTEETAPVAEETKEAVKEETEMSEVDAQVAASVKAKATPVQEVTNEHVITARDAKTMIVNALGAKFSKDNEGFDAIAKDMQIKNVIDGTTGAPLFVEEVLANDIREQYTVYGRVGNLVNRIDIEGAETYKQLVQTAGAGFQPVALGSVKSQDQPVWTPVTFEPFEWALIVAWLDGVQKRTPIAVYNQVVRYIAEEYAKLEDKIILTYAGGSVGGETRPATGLVPVLTTASRSEPVSSYASDDVIEALGSAYGEIESDKTITLVANRKTWGKLATSLDKEGRPIFTVVGEQVAAGALGTFNVVQSQALSEGDVVIGAFDDYNLVTRGALGTLFSREATIGSGETALNLFTQDASALRADVDITGGAVFNTSFYLLKFPSGS